MQMCMRNWDHRNFMTMTDDVGGRLYENINTFTHTQRYLHLLPHFHNYIYSTFMLITGHCRGTINFPSHKHTYIFINKQLVGVIRLVNTAGGIPQCFQMFYILSLFFFFFFFWSGQPQMNIIDHGHKTVMWFEWNWYIVMSKTPQYHQKEQKGINSSFLWISPLSDE